MTVCRWGELVSLGNQGREVILFISSCSMLLGSDVSAVGAEAWTNMSAVGAETWTDMSAVGAEAWTGRTQCVTGSQRSSNSTTRDDLVQSTYFSSEHLP